MLKLLFPTCVAAAFFATSGSAADNCGPNLHVMRLEKFGLIPDLQYFCAGQQVSVMNATSNTVRIIYKDASGKEFTTASISSGKTSVPFTGEATLTGVKVGTNLISGFKAARIVSGVAPDSY